MSNSQTYDYAVEPLPDYREYPTEEMLERAHSFYRDIARRRSVREFDSRPVPREVIEQCLLAPAGVALGDIEELLSIPVATAQCHHFLRERLPDIEVRAANSTADAARIVAEGTEVPSTSTTIPTCLRTLLPNVC